MKNHSPHQLRSKSRVGAKYVKLFHHRIKNIIIHGDQPGCRLDLKPTPEG
jgi:hypothetical protein